MSLIFWQIVEVFTRRGCFIYILDSSNSSSIKLELVSLILALEATEPVPEPVTQMAVEQSSHFSTVKEMSVNAIFFFMEKPL